MVDLDSVRPPTAGQVGILDAIPEKEFETDPWGLQRWQIEEKRADQAERRFCIGAGAAELINLVHEDVHRPKPKTLNGA